MFFTPPPAQVASAVSAGKLVVCDLLTGDESEVEVLQQVRLGGRRGPRGAPC